MNYKAIENFSKLKSSLLIIPLAIILILIFFLYTKNALTTEGYIAVQKDLFYDLNAQLSPYSILENNLTQMGDALIVLSILSIFFIYLPKMWEALIASSLLSLIFSAILKKVFAVPRPAAVLDQESFHIIGKVLTGHNSLPSGHSITVFTVISVIFFVFMPKKWSGKLIWCFVMVLSGLILISSRIAVGAHFPLDTIFGGLIGIISGLLGIFFVRRYNLWNWISDKRFYPIFMVLFMGCGIVLIQKITKENLVIFYIAIICLVVSLYQMVKNYAKK